MAGLKEFKALLAQDAALLEEAKKCGSFDELVALAGERGFSFTAEEIEALTDLTTEDIAKAAGGFGQGDVIKFVQVLVSGHKA